ncbi:chorismate mutase [Streptomyces sp. TRM72054]|uniref:chorismate mutase n=1 Tax=Streptomyces sp. TRM72054 TaxID=2870562 RepID=UPI0035AB7793
MLVAASSTLLLPGAAAMPAVAQPQPAASAPSAANGLTPLTDLLADRLLIADKVAAAKYGTDRPIDDPAREQKILDDVAARAVGLGLDPHAVVAYPRWGSMINGHARLCSRTDAVVEVPVVAPRPFW